MRTFYQEIFPTFLYTPCFIHYQQDSRLSKPVKNMTFSFPSVLVTEKKKKKELIVYPTGLLIFSFILIKLSACFVCYHFFTNQKQKQKLGNQLDVPSDFRESSVHERLCPVEECYGGAGEKCEEEGLAQLRSQGLTSALTPCSFCTTCDGRRQKSWEWRTEVEPGSKEGSGEMGFLVLPLILTILL